MKLLVSTLLVALAAAAKDVAYYENGIESPNEEEKMFWGDGLGVLEDLDQFKKLYITYHSCA